MFLLGVARVFKESEKGYVSLTEAEKAYAVVCEEFGEQPNSHTQVWKYTQLLSSLGILRTEVVTMGARGRSTQVSLPAISAVELEKELVASLEKGRG